MVKIKEPPFKDKELVYAASARCKCGAGLAYARKGASGVPISGFWDCSDILTGRAVPFGQEGSVQHSDTHPFVFYEIKGENQPSAHSIGASTRPTS